MPHQAEDQGKLKCPLNPGTCDVLRCAWLDRDSQNCAVLQIAQELKKANEFAETWGRQPA